MHLNVNQMNALNQMPLCARVNRIVYKYENGGHPLVGVSTRPAQPSGCLYGSSSIDNLTSTGTF